MLRTFPKDTALAVLKSALLEDGAIIIENLVSEQVLDKLSGEIAPYLATDQVVTGSEHELANDRTRRSWFAKHEGGMATSRT
jgi:hypothetical protein